MLEKVYNPDGSYDVNKDIYIYKVLDIGFNKKSGLYYSEEVCKNIVKKFNLSISKQYILGELNFHKKYDFNNPNIRRFKTVQMDRAFIKLFLLYIKDNKVILEFKFIRNRKFKNNIQDIKYAIKKGLYSPELVLRCIHDVDKDNNVLNNENLLPITIDINFEVKKEH